MALSVRSNQRGAVLIILAVMTGALLAVFYLLAFRNFVVRDVSRQLRALADRACAEAAQRSYIPKEAADIFVAELESGSAELRYGEVTNARLVLPTMAGDSFSSAGDCGGYTAGPSGGLTCSFGLCPHTADICSGTDAYPPGVFEAPVSNAVTLGCEVSARVTATGIMRFIYFLQPLLGIIGGNPPDEETVTAVVSWWRPLESYPLGTFEDNNIRHGVTLVISPYGQTDPTQKRFHDLTSASLPGGATDPQLFSPYDIAPANIRGGVDSFQVPQLRVNGPFNIGGVDPAVTFPGIPQTSSGVSIGGDRSRTLASCSNAAVVVRNSFLTAFVSLAMRHGHLRDRTRILIPSPYHRNRGGDTVDGVVVFEASGTIPFYDLTLPARPNQPILAWNFGQDLGLLNTSHDRIQYPYFSFYGGVAAAPGGTDPDEEYKVWNEEMGLPLGIYRSGDSPCGEPSCQGWAQPFIYASGTVNQFKWRLNPVSESAYSESPSGSLRIGEFHHLVSGQLANCYNVYSQNHVRLDLLSENLDGNYAQKNALFEPITSPWNLESYLREIQNPNSWRQNCADPFHMCTAETLTPLEFTAGLGMPELCAVDRTIEDPPYQGGGQGWTTCIKPIRPQLDLKGDLIGALSFVKGYDASAGDLQVDALRLPGVFPVKLNGTNPEAPLPANPSHAVKPFVDAAYIGQALFDPSQDPPRWDLSTVVIFTHQRISSNDVTISAGAEPLHVSDPDNSIRGDDLRWEATHVQRLVHDLNLQGRRVVLIYMPLYREDAADAYISVMNDILMCIPGCTGGCGQEECQKQANKLIVLSPYPYKDTLYGGETDHDVLFQKYWSDLLVPAQFRPPPTEEDNVPLDMKSLAESVFDLIVRHEPKL